MTTRLFIAFDIPDDIKDKIIQEREKQYSDRKVKWEKRDKLHITAKFLGDTSDSLVLEIIDRLEAVCKKYSKIKTGLSRFGLFYRNNKPAILWLGFNENEQLACLYNDLDQELFEIGFEKEKRKFKPHLTLLRIRGYEDLEKIKKLASSEIKNIGFYITQVSLYKSELKQTGSVYTKVQSFELR